jgi:hypothetical protein
LAAQNKKLWLKPELTILVRNTPEESVLYSCKVGPSVAAPFTFADGCMQFNSSGGCEPGADCCCSCHKGTPS